MGRIEATVPCVRFPPVRDFERTHVPLNRGCHRDTWVCRLGYPSGPSDPDRKITGKTSKSSVPVLCAQKPWFSQGFSHIGPVPLAGCSAHATRCMAPAALHFASRCPNRVVFRVARVAKTLGFCMCRSGTDPRQRRV
jgi:hypothetical protein